MYILFQNLFETCTGLAVKKVARASNRYWCNFKMQSGWAAIQGKVERITIFQLFIRERTKRQRVIRKISSEFTYICALMKDRSRLGCLRVTTSVLSVLSLNFSYIRLVELCYIYFNIIVETGYPLGPSCWESGYSGQICPAYYWKNLIGVKWLTHWWL